MRILFVDCVVTLAIAAAPLSGQGIISTVAGGRSCTGLGEGGPAVSTCLGVLGLLAVDKQGNLYFWMGSIPSIQKVNVATGIISTVAGGTTLDRKSTRLNSSHLGISYAGFCLEKGWW